MHKRVKTGTQLLNPRNKSSQGNNSTLTKSINYSALTKKPCMFRIGDAGNQKKNGGQNNNRSQETFLEGD